MKLKESKYWAIQNALNYLDASIISIQDTCTHGFLKTHEKREEALEIARQLFELQEQLFSLFQDVESSEQKET